MAKNTKESKAKVTRISASDSTKRTKTPAAKAPKANSTKKPKNKTAESAEKKKGFAARFFGYFTGAWYELRQVHWPTRRATWSLTGAVLLFTAFFVLVILLLDAGFQYLFDQLLT